MTHTAPVYRFWSRRQLPLILQTETAECGLACLAMVAGYWGRPCDLISLRQRFAISPKGVTLADLVRMAETLGLQSRPLQLELEELPKLALPCLLHWEMNHFVVLSRIKGKRLLIHDPAAGERWISPTEASTHFSGIALELRADPDAPAAPPPRKISLFGLMGNVAGLGRGMVQLLALGVLLQLCTLLAPFYLQWTVDDALMAGDRDLISVLGYGFLLLVILQALIGGVRSWLTTVLASQLNYQWMGRAFNHLLRLPASWFEKRHLGDIVSRFGSIQTIQHSLTTQFAEAILDGLLVMATLTVMVVYSPLLSGVALVAVLLYAVLRWGGFRHLRHLNVEQIAHAARQQSHFLESIRGIQTVRLSGGEGQRRYRWMNLLAGQFNAELGIARLTVAFQSAHTIVFGTERVVIIWLAAFSVLDARFTVGMLFAFLAFQEQFSQRISALIDKVIEWRMLRLHGERLADILHSPVEQHDGRRRINDHSSRPPDLELRGISFRYGDAEPEVVDSLSLRIPSGQCIAITGVSGSGKTTVLKLLLGLLDVQHGDILVDNIPLHQLERQDYRQLFGTVMQDDRLFSGSIADNIAFFTTPQDRERIEHCAMMAAIHQDICTMPMGYDTLVGDCGSALSGGQKQRILLARALYRQPRILVLDEATSHLDIWNEKMVNAAIGHIAMTRIVVAHRPETIAMCERVVTLVNGRLHEKDHSPLAEPV